MAFDKRVIGLIIIVGFIAGLIGAFYTHLLHGIQQFVYNYSAADHLSFVAAVADSYTHLTQTQNSEE